MEFDIDQKYAIETTGNLLVSASAGSGKTTVLTNKFMYLVEKSSDIENILVLTFSEKAAYEMKERIELKLTEYLSKIDKTTAVKISKSFLKTNISTLHSFFNKLLLTYFDKLNLNPCFSIIDTTTANNFKKRAFIEVLEKYNQKDDPEYDDLALSLSDGRSDKGLFEALEKYRVLLNTVILNEEYDFDKSLLDCKNYLIEVMRGKVEKYLNILKKIEEECPPNYKFRTCVEDVIRGLEKFIQLDDVFLYELDNIPKIDIRLDDRSGNEKELLKKIQSFKANYAELIKELTDSKNILIESLEKAETSKNAILKFCEIEKEYSNIYDRLKMQENLLDYSDLEKFTVKLLEDENIKEEIKNKYKFILVDEYQDTSVVQEYILSKIENNNLFVVGDVKQSIFNFRHADPTIFLERQKRYDEFKDGKCKNLNNNYRSSKSVIEFINKVFSQLMTKRKGGVDYSKESKLVSVIEYLPEKYLPACEIAIFNKEETTIETKDFYSIKEDNNKKITKNKEGEYIVKTIKKLKNTQIYDPTKGKYRPVEYNDIAILFRSRNAKNSSVIDCLKEAKIPICTDGFVEDDTDCLLIIEFLKVINNRYNDIPLITVMLSFFGRFSNKDLVAIKLNSKKNSTFYECIEDYISNTKIKNQEKDSLSQKLKMFIEYLDSLEQKLMNSSIYGLLCEIVYKSNYDAYIGAGIVALEAFMESFKNIDYSLSRYLYEDITIKEITKEKGAQNNVNIMTIHSAKGLEFPIVFLASANNQFNKQDIRQQIFFDSKLKIGMKNRDLDTMTQTNSIFRRGIEKKKNDDMLNEELRLLYVALTRAKNHLFITGTEDVTGDSDKKKEEYIYKDQNSFLDFFKHAIFFDNSLKEYLKKEEVLKEENLTIQEEKKEDVTIDLEKIEDEMRSRLKIRENHQKFSLKTTVTSISSNDLKNASEKLEVFERGKVYHKVMQLIDFDIEKEEEIADFIQSLVNEGVLTEHESKLVNVLDIERCLKSSIIKYATKNKFYREKEFVIYVQKNEIFDTDENDKIVIQGVIDLLILGEPEGENIIVDYKTGILKEKYLDSYKKQIRLYKKAAIFSGLKIDKAFLYSFDDGNYIEVS